MFFVPLFSGFGFSQCFSKPPFFFIPWLRLDLSRPRSFFCCGVVPLPSTMKNQYPKSPDFRSALAVLGVYLSASSTSGQLFQEGFTGSTGPAVDDLWLEICALGAEHMHVPDLNQFTENPEPFPGTISRCQVTRSLDTRPPTAEQNEKKIAAHRTKKNVPAFPERSKKSDEQPLSRGQLVDRSRVDLRRHVESLGQTLKETLGNMVRLFTVDQLDV